MLAALLVVPVPGFAVRWTFEPEAGVAFPYSNDVRIPGAGGTQFSLTDELTAENEFAWRLRLAARLGEKHALALLVAPLRIESTGTTSQPVLFEGTTFSPTEFLTGTYRFVSYRLTYSYRVYDSTRLRFAFGVNGEDPRCSDSPPERHGDGGEEEYRVVPLLYFRFEAALTRRTSFRLEGDALAAPQGRAEDVLAALELHVSRDLGIFAGYRLLEGGADNDEVYTLASFVIVISNQ